PGGPRARRGTRAGTTTRPGARRIAQTGASARAWDTRRVSRWPQGAGAESGLELDALGLRLRARRGGGHAGDDLPRRSVGQSQPLQGPFPRDPIAVPDGRPALSDRAYA